MIGDEIYVFVCDPQGLDEDLPDASALENANALALAIIPEGECCFS